MLNDMVLSAGTSNLFPRCTRNRASFFSQGNQESFNRFDGEAQDWMSQAID